jgi:16S rRNA (cytosine1402-N4)-methyltransferase
MSGYHQPVLLQQVGTFLKVSPGLHYVDATLGGGGHTMEIIRLGGKVLGLDQDPDALSACPDSDQLVKVRSNFIHLAEVVKANNWQPIFGVLFDLGVSQHQIATPARGFSFQSEGPLDMRMDPVLPVTAGFLINNLPVKDLARLFRDFGEEPRAAFISEKIVAARPLNTSSELSRLLPNPDTRRRVFQALRIAVNDELGALTAVLPQSLDILTPGGRILVISFHSLEDTRVKNQFTAWAESGLGKIITEKPVVPDETEKAVNPRSKSAKLRVFEKLYV